MHDNKQISQDCRSQRATQTFLPPTTPTQLGKKFHSLATNPSSLFAEKASSVPETLPPSKISKANFSPPCRKLACFPREVTLDIIREVAIAHSSKCHKTSTSIAQTIQSHPP